MELRFRDVEKAHSKDDMGIWGWKIWFSGHV